MLLFLILLLPVYKDHLSTRSTFFVSLENGFSLKHVLKEPVYKDHFLSFPWAVAVDRFDCTCTTPTVAVSPHAAATVVHCLECIHVTRPIRRENKESARYS